jgi:hypothetical protein
MPPKKKAKAKEKKPIHEFYDVEITKWSPHYSFGTNSNRKIQEGPYSEFFGVNISGVFLGPAKVVGREVEVNLYADHRISEVMFNDRAADKDPGHVGWLTSRGSHSNCYGWFPRDIIPGLMTMLSAGKIRFVHLNGLALKYGEAPIHHFSFAEEREE